MNSPRVSGDAAAKAAGVEGDPQSLGHRKPLRPKIYRNGRLRKACKEKSGAICAECGMYDAKGEADHILALWLGGGDTLANLQWLCRNCHKQKTISDVPLRAKADRLAARDRLTRMRRAIR